MKSGNSIKYFEWRVDSKTVLLSTLHREHQFRVLKGIFNSFATHENWEPITRGNTSHTYVIHRDVDLWFSRLEFLINLLHPEHRKTLLNYEGEYVEIKEAFERFVGRKCMGLVTGNTSTSTKRQSFRGRAASQCSR